MLPPVAGLESININWAAVPDVFLIITPPFTSSLNAEDSNGDALLVFSAGGKEQIPVGYVDARQKGKGFEGTVGFEILCNDEFVRQCAEANKKNGDTSGANSRKADQLAQRKAAGEKRKQSSSDDTNDDEA